MQSTSANTSNNINNVYAENYNENGYLSDWQIYTKWLQGTLNKKVLILELGVGLVFPSVIRWPFEKIAFYNQKEVIYEGLNISRSVLNFIKTRYKDVLNNPSNFNLVKYKQNFSNENFIKINAIVNKYKMLL